MLVGLSLLWGSSFYFYKVLAGSLPPLTIVLGRVGIAAVVLNLVLLARGERLGWGLPWGAFLLLALLNNVVPFGLFAWGEQRIPSGMAGMLNATTPLFSVLLAHVLTRDEKLSWGRAAGVLLGMAGVAVLVGPAGWRGVDGAYLAGDGACVLASVSYAFGGIYGRRFRAIGPWRLATAQITAAAVIALPLAAGVERFWTLPMPGLAVWGALAGIGVLCTVLAYVLYFRILATAGATNVVLVTFLVPITALPIGWVFLGEAVPGRDYAGMGLIGMGLAAIDGRVWRRVVG